MHSRFSLALLVLLAPLALSSLLQEGNKRRVQTRAIQERKSQTGSCSARVSSWKTWDGGFTGTIKVHTATDAPVDTWTADLELSKPVDYLESFDGNADATSGDTFTVKSASYNGKAEAGEEREFTVQGKLAAGKAPLLKSLAINGGEKVVCREEIEPSVIVKTNTERHHCEWPKRTLGLYILLADDDEEGFESESTSWTPELFNWQQEASNVLFFTFIHPDTMDIPPSFKKLSDTRGTDAPGAVPKDTVIMFAIGGYAYSIKPNPWHWLETKEAAEAMAVRVAQWYDDYNMDGIDLDLEEGAGARKEAGPNMIHFIRKVKELQPKMIVSQPTYGYPQVQAENDVINASWDDKENSKNLADIIGLMVYEGTLALQYVKNYNKGSEQWEGFPIKINAPSNAILLGAKGATSSANILKLARASVDQDLSGIMVWYASVKNGFDYAPFWDASTKQDSIDGYKQAMKILDLDNKKDKEDKKEKEDKKDKA